jgi:hypothetical protein
MVETKVKAGAVAGGVTGLVVWALVSYIPAFHNGVPQPVLDVLPFALAWIGHTVAAYMAPHTSRPGLRPRVNTPDVTGVTGGPLSGLR